VVCPAYQIRQELFTARTPLGNELRLVLLSDGRCAIVQDGDVVETSNDGDQSMDDLVKRFLELAGEP
jgi:hypothetical protein